MPNFSSNDVTAGFVPSPQNQHEFAGFLPCAILFYINRVIFQKLTRFFFIIANKSSLFFALWQMLFNRL